MRRPCHDPATPLADVTFCVLDLETTGGDPAACGITEVGAVKVRGGEVLGTFQTLVDPGSAIPPTVTALTGLTDAVVRRAPTMAQVLPSLLEFVGGSVLVGHNVRFDVGFLQVALGRWGGPPLTGAPLDTLALSRCLLADEVPDHRLGSLAEHLDLPHRPSHRALDDALATCDALHVLIERSSAWGVVDLDDLVALPALAGQRQWRKLRLTAGLPHRPGVYRFLGRDGRPLHVGTAEDLRHDVRSLFVPRAPAWVAQLLRETHDIGHHVCRSAVEAEVLERRAQRQHVPRFDRRGRRPTACCYVRLTDERFPRLSIVRGAPPSAPHVGPLADRREAEQVVAAILAAVPLRRCRRRVPSSPTADPCPTPPGPAAGPCPCRGGTTEAAYARGVAVARRGLGGEAHLLLQPLADLMWRLAAQRRYEEAAAVRDGARTLARALSGATATRRLAAVERLVVRDAGGTVVEVGPGGCVDGDGPTHPDEVALLAAWLDRHAGRARLLHVGGTWCSALLPPPSFDASEQAPTR